MIARDLNGAFYRPMSDRERGTSSLPQHQTERATLPNPARESRHPQKNPISPTLYALHMLASAHLIAKNHATIHPISPKTIMRGVVDCPVTTP